MNIGIACVVGRLKKNRKYKCAGTWSLVSIKKHTEDQDLCQKFCRGGWVSVKATNFSDFSGCSFMQCIEGMFGKNLLQISITPASIKVLVINVYFQDISSQEKFILFYLYGSASLLMFHLVYSDINILPISVL